MSQRKNVIYMLQNQGLEQMNSFIIETESGEIIVIDGGWRLEWPHFIERLKEISGQEKPHIAAWILSHAHEDHIECFMEMLENYPESVTFEHIYFRFPSLQFVERNEAATVPILRRFYELLPCFADKVVFVDEGDCYQIGNAVIEILYSPRPEWTENAVNNSTVVFRMLLGGKKIMFLGDIGSAGNQLIDKYGADLKSDYCQMTHHGQAEIQKEVYQLISPEVCLWCAPKWLWNNDVGGGFNSFVYTTVVTREWMEEMGVSKHYVIMDGDQTIIIE